MLQSSLKKVISNKLDVLNAGKVIKKYKFFVEKLNSARDNSRFSDPKTDEYPWH